MLNTNKVIRNFINCILPVYNKTGRRKPNVQKKRAGAYWKRKDY